MDDAAGRGSAVDGATLERQIRHMGRAVMGLSLKVSELAESVRRLEPGAGGTGAAGEAGGTRGGGDRADAPPGFEAIAEVIDGLDRVIDRLSSWLAGLPEEAEPTRVAASSAERGEPRSWLGSLGSWARRRALGSRSTGARTASTPQSERAADARGEVGTALDGLRLLRRSALDRLAHKGAIPIAREGVFDPRHHRVVGTEAGAPAGEIVRTLRRGFTVGGDGDERARVLRPGLVVVGELPEARRTGEGSRR